MADDIRAYATTSQIKDFNMDLRCLHLNNYQSQDCAKDNLHLPKSIRHHMWTNRILTRRVTWTQSEEYG